MGYGELLHKSEQRTISSAICVYIDANGLHELNNERGHEAGDLMLRFVAESLMEQFPKGSLYRVGGDEFVVFPAPVEGADLRGPYALGLREHHRAGLQHLLRHCRA